MFRVGCLAAVGAALVALLGIGYFAGEWFANSGIEEDTVFIVPSGSSLTSIAEKLEDEDLIASADGFLLRAKVFGGSEPIKAGEFLLPMGASASVILDTFQNGDVIRRAITIPEGMPSVFVYEALLAERLLTGDIPVPREGSVLPETYDFERGESRRAVLGRMQAAMTETLTQLWATRAKDIAVASPADAVILASIVEKETGVPRERKMVAGLYSNRVKRGMLLQADPTIIYPITKGKPLGRRIRRSEIDAVNGYNTYTMAGLPKGPITNPGRASIAAVLNPAATDALYMVADGSRGHEFNATLQGHNAAVERWRAIRRKRGEL